MVDPTRDDDAEDEIEALRVAWRALEPSEPMSDGDAETLAVVSALRRAWGELPIPAPRMGRERDRLPIVRVAALAAALLAAAVLLYGIRVSAPSATSDEPTVPDSPVVHAPRPESPGPSHDARLVADLTFAVLGRGTSVAMWPVACLCCEALFLASVASESNGNSADDAIAEALAADCRGEWSTAVELLAPILDRADLTPNQRTRASIALAHAYRQLGNLDDAQRTASAVAAANVAPASTR